MIDARLQTLAGLLVNYSTRVQPGDRVLVEAIDVPAEFTAEIIRVVSAAGGQAFVTIKQNAVLRELYRTSNTQSVRLAGLLELRRMERMQCYIGVRGNPNVSELSDVPEDKLRLYQTYWWQPVHSNQRVRKTRWVVLRYPSESMAQLAGMSTEAFEGFYFRVCSLDYARLSEAAQPLRDLMARTDRVRITAPGTDLAFSIKGIPIVPCEGRRNVPDGEMFTAPVRDSVNGTVRFNTPTVYHGSTFTEVRLRFQDGRIVEATAAQETQKLNAILDSDEGARYLGEFSLGFNPFIREPMKDTLFDEKIAGSLHLTPGSAYDEADNGNRSQVHWDLVLIQRPEHGGGEVWFDDACIRSDGRFTLAELAGLNPESFG